MCKSNIEIAKSFTESLCREFRLANSIFNEYYNLNERIKDHLQELQLSPLFFSMAKRCFLDDMVLTTTKLLSGYNGTSNDTKSLFKFFSFIYSNNISILKYDHKSLCSIVDAHKSELLPFHSLLDHLFIWRDKYIAHFDAKYFDDQGKLAIDAPFSLDELSTFFDLLENIFKKYSVIFNNEVDTFTYLNQCDINIILNKLSSLKAIS